MFYSGPSGNETTFYATPKFEKVYAGGGGEYRSYIYAGNRPVVVVMRNTAGAINVRSLLVDHQGGISSIVADSTGASLVSESFTAYGSRREASTWSGTPSSTELAAMNGVTRAGYTFQTVLGSMGLNHMNGRIEDSVTGRFLSPDPRGTIPGNTQSWNRYSYVNNNPLTATDPTGFEEKICQETDCGGGGGGDGSGGGEPPATPPPNDGIPEVGCGIPPLGPCYAPTPPSYNPPLTPTPAAHPSQSGGGGNAPKQSPNQQIPCLSGVDCYTQPAQQPPPPPPPCYANRGNNSHVGRNIGIGALGGGLGIGVLAAVNIVGFPEVEVVEGIGGLLGGLSALGDFGFIALNFGAYGATAGGIAGFAATPSQCAGN
jgi:RHS repeat-associated protein